MNTWMDQRMESYQDEIARIDEDANELARIVSWRGEAEAHAAGVRSGGHLLDYLPAGQPVGGVPCAPPDSSGPPSPTPGEASPPALRRGAGEPDERTT